MSRYSRHVASKVHNKISILNILRDSDLTISYNIQNSFCVTWLSSFFRDICTACRFFNNLNSFFKLINDTGHLYTPYVCLANLTSCIIILISALLTFLAVNICSKRFSVSNPAMYHFLYWVTLKYLISVTF